MTRRRENTPSEGVRLEVAILTDQAAPEPAGPAAAGESARLTVLVVAAERDLRCYVRECLRERTDVRVIEAASAAGALAVAAQESPALLIVDAREREIIVSLGKPRAIVIVDEVPRNATASATRVRYLARPFTREEMVAEVDRLLT